MRPVPQPLIRGQASCPLSLDNPRTPSVVHVDLHEVLADRDG